LRGFSLLKFLVSRRLRAALGWALSALTAYAIPLVIALISLIALVAWDERYDAEPERQLDVQVLLQPGAEQTPSDVRRLLLQQPKRRHFDTRLSEQPVWFAVNVRAVAEPAVLEFPSRHATELACWEGQSLRWLGQASGAQATGQITAVKSGYVLRPTPAETDFICRARFVGPARLTVLAWTEEKLAASAEEFQRKSGLFEGGLLVLGVFVLLTALINRERIYFIFGAWLLIGLRVGSTSGGWDTQWLNHTIPTDWLPHLRSMTLASYALLTLTLYRTMFRDALQRTRYAKAIEVVHWLCVPLLALAVILPRGIFIPTMWLVAGPGLALMTASLLTIVVKTRSRVALWYGASLTFTFVSSFSEIVAAAYGLKGLLVAFNSVTAALASSLLASIAIAEQIRQEHQQRLAAQALLQHTYDAMPIGLFTLDLQGQFVRANPALHRMLGRHLSRRRHDCWDDYFQQDAWPTLYRLLRQQKDCEIEVRGNGDVRDGQVRRYLVKATLTGDKIEGSLQDITVKSLATEELNFLANHDSLTKVLNRRGVEAVYDEALAGLDAQRPLAMAYLDLDRFKLINDLYGHNSGDEILRQVCARVMRLLSGGMRMGRIGGDEFVILLPDTKMTLAHVVCRSIVDSIDGAPYKVGDKAFQVRGSIGLIEIAPGTPMKDAISTADHACRTAKAGNGKGMVVYELDAPAFREHQAELQLVERLSTGEAIEGLFVEMQPIMSLTRPYDALNFEVLLRMRDPQGQQVPLHRLIAAAEHSGRMSMIDRWVLSTTLAWLDLHRAELAKTQFVCVNLSGTSLNDEEFMLEVFDMLRCNSHVVDFLSIEITESVALHDLDNTRRFIDKVRGYGARVALDDFGAGYTSFSYLKELPADLLKIDGSFIVNMNQHPANISIVEAIVNLARNLGMKTVAEWAEDAATVETLAEIGVDYVQGFVVARPQPPERLLAATSAASFVEDEKLLQLLALASQPGHALATPELILDDPDDVSRKMH